MDCLQAAIQAYVVYLGLHFLIKISPMVYNRHTADLVSRFTQAQLQLSKQLVKCNKAMRCGFNSGATTCTEQMAAISRSLGEAKFSSSL